MCQHRHLRRTAPIAADPDREIRVAALEFDPDAGADDRHGEYSGVDSGNGNAGHCPGARHEACEIGHHRLNAADLKRVDVVDHRAAVFAVKCVAAHVGTDGKVETSALRASVNPCL